MSLWFRNKSFEANPQVIKGLPNLLDQLAKKKIIMGISTNDQEETAHYQLKQSNLHSYFSYIFGSDSGFGSKPDIGMQKEFIKLTKIKPQNILMVGDSEFDMISGKNSGMISVGVLTGPASEEELSRTSDFVLNSVCDIPQILN